MTDMPLDDFEQLLAGLPLKPPPASLDGRIADALAYEPIPLRMTARRRLWLYGALAAAAAVALLLTALSLPWKLHSIAPLAPGNSLVQGPSNGASANGQSPAWPQTQTGANGQSAAGAHSPIRYEQVDTQWVDDGVIQTSEFGPMRVLRQTSTKRVVVYDPATNTRSAMIEPTDCTIYVPIDRQ
jgi:hypothetical protein